MTQEERNNIKDRCKTLKKLNDATKEYINNLKNISDNLKNINHIDINNALIIAIIQSERTLKNNETLLAELREIL